MAEVGEGSAAGEAPQGAASPASTSGFAPPAHGYTLRLINVRSFIIFTQRSEVMRSGSLEQVRGFARQVLIKNLLLGWWGFPFGLVWTPIALYRNSQALRKLGELERSGAVAAGWFPDPSGRHGARYWDGNEWTDNVSDLSTDALPQGAPATGA